MVYGWEAEIGCLPVVAAHKLPALGSQQVLACRWGHIALFVRNTEDATQLFIGEVLKPNEGRKPAAVPGTSSDEAMISKVARGHCGSGI